MKHSLRVAFLIAPSGELPAWEMEMLESIMDSEKLSVVAFIVGDQKLQEREGLGMRLFRKFENWWFRSMKDAFENRKVTELYADVKLIDKTEVGALQALNLDIIYKSYNVPDEHIQESFSRFGLWYFTFGAGQYFDSRPIAFWEVMHEVPEIGSSLLVKQSGKSDSIPIYEGTTPTVPYSVKNTLNNIAWKSSSFMPYRALELATGGQSIEDIKIKTPLFWKTSVSTSNPPGSFEVFCLFIRNGFNYLLDRFYRLIPEKRFTISYSWQEFSLREIDFARFVSFKLPKGGFWADPFVFQKDGKTCIFFEEFLYQKDKAHISVLELKNDGTYTQPAIVLDKTYHLSYPFIFEFEDNIYMIPETAAQGTVELYKCTRFPLKWEFVKNLMENIVLIDPTLFFYKGKWWLFGNSSKHPFVSTNDQLFIYYSDSPLSSNWTSHPRNPVATSLSNCRPAGRIFESDGKIYRPAQNNSSRQYGYAIKINEIVLLNEQEFEETEVVDIVPGKNNKFSAVHTINFANNIIIIDCIV